MQSPSTSPHRSVICTTVQEELRKTMVDAMRLLRINIGTSGPTSSAPPTSTPSDGGGGGKGPSTSTSTSASATPSLTVGETDVIRGLDEADMQFIKDKLVSHGSDRVRMLLRITY